MPWQQIGNSSCVSEMDFANVFSTLQYKLGGDLTFSLLYHHGHLKILIYFNPQLSLPFVAAA